MRRLIAAILLLASLTACGQGEDPEYQLKRDCYWYVQGQVLVFEQTVGYVPTEAQFLVTWRTCVEIHAGRVPDQVLPEYGQNKPWGLEVPE